MTVKTKAINLTNHTAKIKHYQEQERAAVFEIGRILSEVKAAEIPRGRWLSWLDSVDFNQRTAQRYIQIYERFYSIPQARELSIGKLTEFLGLPVDVDASEIIHELKGESVRMIREKIREMKGGNVGNVSKDEPVDDVQAREVSRLNNKIAELEKALADERRQRKAEESENARLRTKVAELDFENAVLKFKSSGGGADNGLKVFAHMVGLSDGATRAQVKRAFRKAQANAHPDATNRDWVSQRYNTASDLFNRMYG